jgi:hypothetical protein
MVETANSGQAVAMRSWMDQTGFWLYKRIEQDHFYLNKDDYAQS